MAGGAGDDTYVVDATGDVVTERCDEGTDLSRAASPTRLSANVENLTLTGAAAINGTGNALNNTLTGNAGDNVLDGGAGDDTMVGGAGNDTYVVDSAGDVVTETSTTEGTDTVQSSISYTLGANVENLTLTGTGNINATGNALANTLTGNAGDNVLDGGTGNDTMIGGAGNDTYVVDATGDVVTEASGEGTDLIQSSVTYTLGANVENLTLTGNERDQCHRQRARQHADRQLRQQHPERRRRQRHDGRRRRQRYLCGRCDGRRGDGGVGERAPTWSRAVSATRWATTSRT